MKLAPLAAAEHAPNVCVIIAAYNAEATIGRAIRSALSEAEVAEVIVVDDASLDQTVLAAKACDDGSGRLVILEQEQNAGPSAARNRAIDASHAPWISILDADDFFLPGRMKTLLAYAGKADLIADDMWQVEENATDQRQKNLMGDNFTSPRMISLHEFVISNISRPGKDRGELGFIKPMIRRQLLRDYRISYQPHMRLGEDFEIYSRILVAGGKLLLIPNRGYISVVRQGSLSSKHSITDLMYFRDSISRLEEHPLLTRREKNALKKHYRSVDCRLQWRLLIDAVKERDISAAFQTFCHPHPVPYFLLKQLVNQFFLRFMKRSK